MMRLGLAVCLVAGGCIGFLPSCRHHSRDEVVAQQVEAGAPMTVYYCSADEVRQWLNGDLDWQGKAGGVRLKKKEVQAVRECIAAIRSGSQAWPPGPADAASSGRFLFVSEGKVIFSIFRGKELIQYPLTQTRPDLWARSRKRLEKALREASSPAPDGT